MKNAIAPALAALVAGLGLTMSPSAALAQPPDPPPPTLETPPPPDIAHTPDIACPADAASAPRLWVGAEYLLWWIKNGPIDVPMLTTGTTSITTRSTVGGFVGSPINFPFTQGGLGVPGTSVLYGASGLDYGSLSGIRVTTGGWLDADGLIGIESSDQMQRRSFVLDDSHVTWIIIRSGIAS
jgi:hypothetical protein